MTSTLQDAMVVILSSNSGGVGGQRRPRSWVQCQQPAITVVAEAAEVGCLRYHKTTIFIGLLGLGYFLKNIEFFGLNSNLPYFIKVAKT